MAALSSSLTPAAREQNSRASQAVIFWSGAKVVALVPLTTPWAARYSTSSRAQWPTMSENPAAEADTVSRETAVSAASARDRILLPFIVRTSLLQGFHNYSIAAPREKSNLQKTPRNPMDSGAQVAVRCRCLSARRGAGSPLPLRPVQALAHIPA